MVLVRPNETLGAEMEKKMLTTAEAAEYMNVATGTLRWWRHIGEGPKSFTLGTRKVLYRKVDIDNYLESQYANAVGGEIG